MIIEISVAVIAVAFVFLVIFAIIAIRALRVTLEEANTTLADIRKHLGDVGTLNQDVNGKMESLNPIFNAFSNIGDYLEQKTKSYKLEADICALRNEANEATLDEEEEHPKPNGVVADVMTLVGVGYRLWQNLNKRR